MKYLLMEIDLKFENTKKELECKIFALLPLNIGRVHCAGQEGQQQRGNEWTRLVKQVGKKRLKKRLVKKVGKKGW